jgi:uncharacterized protein YegL
MVSRKEDILLMNPPILHRREVSILASERLLGKEVSLMTVMEVFTLLLVLFAGGTFMLSIITFVIKVIETRDKKRK